MATGTGAASGITEGMVARFADCPDPRLRLLLQDLVARLHAFVREQAVTEEEWQAAVAFLTEVGQTCTDRRQEMILLSDVLGISTVVDAVSHPAAGGTESTVLGPFHVAGAPWREMGSDLSERPGDGEAMDMAGRVLDVSGAPVDGAVLDVWQNAASGTYAAEDPSQPATNLRGRFRTGADGRYWFTTVRPTDYQIPVDGPVGALLRATHRPAWRPAHVHVIVTAPGHRRLVTHLFDADSPHLGADAVGGVKGSLVCRVARDAGSGRWSLERDLVLAASPAGAVAGRTGSP